MDHRKLSNSEVRDLLNNIFTKGDGNAANFGVTQDLIDEAKTRGNALTAKMNDQTAKKAASKAATTSLNLERKDDDEWLSDFKLLMRTNKVSADKFVEFGFDADDLVPSPIAPQTPLELFVIGSSNGINALKWKSNGNKPRVIYLIEAKIGAATDYTIVGTSTKTSFNHKNQTPGVKAMYRVRAQRGEELSDYSNEAVVYG